MASWRLLSCALLIYNTGSSAVDTVFVETGASVQLDIQGDQVHNHIKKLDWMKDNKDIIVEYTGDTEVKLPPSYKTRVDFNNVTFSLTLKNMQKTDSGLYTARTRINFSEINIAEYRVSVIDAVKAPDLAVNSWFITEPCNFTCKADNMAIISIYNNSTCLEAETSDGLYNLSLKCTDDFITCNHSNPVSWKNDTRMVQQFCTINPERRTSSAQSTLLYWLILICVLLVCAGAVAGAVADLCYHKRKKDAEPSETTVYAEVDDKRPQESIEMKRSANAEKNPDETIQTTGNPDSMNQEAPTTEKSRTDKLVTIYCTVQQHPPPTAESVYAAVNKPSAGFESVR